MNELEEQRLTELNRGRHLSYQRSRHVTHSQTSLIKIEGVDDTNAAKYAAPNTRDEDDVADPVKTASTSARRSPTSTRPRRRSAAPGSASSGARSPALTVHIPRSAASAAASRRPLNSTPREKLEKILTGLQATPASSVPSSATPFHPSPSVLRSASCFTPLRYKMVSGRSW